MGDQTCRDACVRVVRNARRDIGLLLISIHAAPCVQAIVWHGNSVNGREEPWYEHFVREWSALERNSRHVAFLFPNQVVGRAVCYAGSLSSSRGSSNMTDLYSLWVVPTGTTAEKLELEIKTLAEAHGGPKFPPHVTVAPCIAGSEADVVAKKTQQLATSLQV
jgi:hypothetical protein